jgi:hypothetical protein
MIGSDEFRGLAMLFVLIFHSTGRDNYFILPWYHDSGYYEKTHGDIIKLIFLFLFFFISVISCGLPAMYNLYLEDFIWLSNLLTERTCRRLFQKHVVNTNSTFWFRTFSLIEAIVIFHINWVPIRFLVVFMLLNLYFSV